MKTLSILILAIVAMPAAGDVYKCTSADGRVIYSDRPCPGRAEKLAIRSAPSPEAARAAALAGATTEREIAIANNRVYVGMWRGDVILSWGEPTRINSTLGGGGKREQFVYDRGRHSQYVYLENAVVTSIQSQD